MEQAECEYPYDMRKTNEFSGLFYRIVQCHKKAASEAKRLGDMELAEEFRARQKFARFQRADLYIENAKALISRISLLRESKANLQTIKKA
jgi:hypothetical protein